MKTTIRIEPPDTAEARVLITELDAYLGDLYPEESNFGYNIEQLLAEDVTFFLLRHDGNPAGCCAFQNFDGEYGEIKRMYVRPAYRGFGYGRMMLDFICDFARNAGLETVRLEAGIHQPEAIALYERYGFYSIPPFGDYPADPLCLFFEKRLV